MVSQKTQTTASQRTTTTASHRGQRGLDEDKNNGLAKDKDDGLAKGKADGLTEDSDNDDGLSDERRKIGVKCFSVSILQARSHACVCGEMK